MKRSWMIWLGAGLVAPALALGCRNTRPSVDGPAAAPFPPPLIGAAAPSQRTEIEIAHVQAVPPTAMTVLGQQ